MRFKQLAAFTLVAVLGCSALTATAEAQGHIGPYAAREVIEEPSTTPSDQLSSFSIDFRMWTAQIAWLQANVSVTPIRFTGALTPMSLPDRRWRLQR